jgi:hypothetical protein
MTAAGAADQNGAETLVELPAAMNGRWIQVDLDEVLEAVEFCGLPQRELIATYLDRRSRRRMFVRVHSHRKEAKS